MAQRLPVHVAHWARAQAVLGRVGCAHDIAVQVVTFCQAESVTGQVLVIDGGMPGGMH
jgi:3-oxoacyl-[acyl-carrier protein] reductase